MSATADGVAEAPPATVTGRLVTGSVHRHLARMTLPMTGGMLAAIGFNAIDTLFVAQLGTEALAAISFTFPVVFIFIGLSIGLSAGSASALSRAIGQGDQAHVQRLATDALILSVAIVAVCVAIGIATTDPLFRALGATDETLPLIRQYMLIWYLGMPALVVPMVGNGLIRATGNAVVPGLIMVGGSLINVILDPLLIFGWFGFPRLEITGAALATVAARMVTLVAALWVLRRMGLIAFCWPTLASMRRSWPAILAVGLPASATNIINPVAVALVTRILASFGPEAVAAFGVATRIEALALIVYFAMSSVIGPLVGQNWGAGRLDRVRDAFWGAFFFCGASALALAAGLWLVAPTVTGWFSTESQVQATATAYLLLVPISYGGAAVVIVGAAGFNGIGRPLPSMLFAITRMVGLYVPLAFLLAGPFHTTGIFMAAASANLLTGALVLGYVYRLCGRAGTGRV